jgi:inosine-uridine nucleoside N-ribohydrolase
MRQGPDIVPLIKQIIIMGGNIYVPGNSYIRAGETNWWFDPEAARIVLRADVDRKIIPLDVTGTVAISDEMYDYIANYTPATAITQLFKSVEHWPYVYNTVALASLYDPSLDLDVKKLYVDVSCDFDAEYGKGLVWEEDPYPGIGVEKVSDVVFKLDNGRFFDLYKDLLTRPLPVSKR